jgi:hypothetical protein
MRHAKEQIFGFPREKAARIVSQEPRPTDPSEQEIQRLCEQIQADWSEDEREARRLWMPMNQTLVRPNRANLERFTVPWVKVG